MFGPDPAKEFEDHGRVDAEHGVDQFQLHAEATLGPEPAFAPASNHLHRQVAADLREGDIVEDVQLDVGRLEREMAASAPFGLMAVGLIGAVVLEAWGAVLVLRSMGVRPVERIPLGLGLALAIVGLTAVVSRHSNETGQDASPKAPPAAHRRAGVLLVYLLLGAAVAVVRLAAVENEASGVASMAFLGLTLALTLGPAWMTEWLIRRLPRARELRRNLTLARRRLQIAERRVESAQRFLARLTTEAETWKSEAAPLRAAYRRGHQRNRQPADGQAAPGNPPRLRR